MLVVPALLSLKPQIIEKAAPEAVELIQKIIKKFQDP
jgi:hypothetical protein